MGNCSAEACRPCPFNNRLSQKKLIKVFEILQDEDMGRKEGIIENYLRNSVKALGGGAECRKVVYQGRTGALDQWCFMPNGKLLIVECKAPGEPLKRHQRDEMEWLQGLGFEAHWVDSKEAIDKLLEEYREFL